MLLNVIVEVSRAVSATRARSRKIELLADTLRRLTPVEAPIAVSYLSGRPTQRRLGVGYATVYGVESPPTLDPELEVVEVDRVLGEISRASGPGSQTARIEMLTDLMNMATEPEQEFLRGLILKNLRQGALEGVMADAVAVLPRVPDPEAHPELAELGPDAPRHLLSRPAAPAARSAQPGRG